MRLRRGIGRITRPSKGMQWQRGVVGGVPVERTVSVGATATLIYLHGGAYGLGSAYGYRRVAARLAEAAWMTVVVPDYSLAPQARYPVALEELVAVYSALLADGRDPKKTVIAGDSAGGGLTLALAMVLRDRKIPLPAALGLICPLSTPVYGDAAGLPPIVLHRAGDDIHLKAGVLSEADFAIAELGARLRTHVQVEVANK